MPLLNVNAVFVTLAIFIAGVIFHAGRLSSRVDKIEEWRGEVRDDIRTIRQTIDHINGALRHEPH